MILKVNKDKPDKEIIQQAVEVLEQGGVLIMPTETAYGIVCDATNKKAIEKVYKIKGREKNKFLPLVTASLIQLQQYFEVRTKELELLKKYPGLSIILKPKLGAQKQDIYFLPGQETAAARVSTNNLVANLAKKLARPLTASSANMAGGENCYSVEDVLRQLGDTTPSSLRSATPPKLGGDIKGVDLILDGGEIKKRKPSTIVKVEGGEVRIVRQGEVEVK